MHSNKISDWYLENAKPVISVAPGKDIFLIIYPTGFITDITPSSDKLLNSKRATYN